MHTNLCETISDCYSAEECLTKVIEIMTPFFDELDLEECDMRDILEDATLVYPEFISLAHAGVVSIGELVESYKQGGHTDRQRTLDYKDILWKFAIKQLQVRTFVVHHLMLSHQNRTSVDHYDGIKTQLERISELANMVYALNPRHSHIDTSRENSVSNNDGQQSEQNLIA